MANNDRSAGVKDRPVFYVSDGTGITAETIGHSVLTQFAGVQFDTQRIPFVDSRERAESAVAQIREAGRVAGVRPIVISTVIHPEIAEVLAISDALVMDVFAPFVNPLESELGVARQPAVGQAHGLIDFAAYEARIEATNYAMSHDDGVALNFDEADVVLVGVSRSGKTPTCLYMALHFGVRAGNYPLTDEDLDSSRLPKRLEPYREKLFGLTIDPMRLQQIRQARRPDSPYASMAQCRAEVATAEAMFRRERLPSLSTTHTSIEEIASKVLAQFGIDKHMF